MKLERRHLMAIHTHNSYQTGTLLKLHADAFVSNCHLNNFFFFQFFFIEISDYMSRLERNHTSRPQLQFLTFVHAETDFP
jgi:hypothetical protein